MCKFDPTNDARRIEMNEKELIKLQNKLSQERYSKDYGELCWMRQLIIDDLIKYQKRLI
jgi:hypothetical protein